MSEDRLGPPPVEPLSDVAWARVERNLWQQLDAAPLALPERSEPPRRRWLWIAAPLVAAMAIVFVVTRGGSSEEHVAPETADVRVVAPPTASTTATFDDAHIELAPTSVVVMRRDRPITMLERGAAWFSVAPRIDRPAFTVLAGDATVRVLGTRFRVARNDERITVEVDHGRVEVQYRDRIQLLGARQRWQSDAPERVEQVLTQTATAEPATEPAPTTPPAPPPEPEPEAIARKPEPAPVIRTERKPDVPKVTTPPIEPPKPVISDQATFESLSVLEKQDPNAALAGYLKLAQQRGSKWAANALFAAGRLAADRKDPLAESLLTTYLKRYPTHANAEDARALIARLRH